MVVCVDDCLVVCVDDCVVVCVDDCVVVCVGSIGVFYSVSCFDGNVLFIHRIQCPRQSCHGEEEEEEGGGGGGEEEGGEEEANPGATLQVRTGVEWKIASWKVNC